MACVHVEVGEQGQQEGRRCECALLEGVHHLGGSRLPSCCHLPFGAADDLPCVASEAEHVGHDHEHNITVLRGGEQIANHERWPFPPIRLATSLPFPEAPPGTSAR